MSYSAYNLMDVRRWIRAGIDQRIEPLYGQLCAPEAQQTRICASEKA
jgi:hypothetical protein